MDNIKIELSNVDRQRIDKLIELKEDELHVKKYKESNPKLRFGIEWFLTIVIAAGIIGYGNGNTDEKAIDADRLFDTKTKNILEIEKATFHSSGIVIVELEDGSKATFDANSIELYSSNSKNMEKYITRKLNK